MSLYLLSNNDEIYRFLSLANNRDMYIAIGCVLGGAFLLVGVGIGAYCFVKKKNVAERPRKDVIENQIYGS